MENAKKHWKILQELGNDLANRVRSFMVIGRDGNGVIVATRDGDGYWLGEMKFEWGETKTVTKPTPLDVPGLVQMAQGCRHILLLNKRGQIYSMAMNNRGQLGLGTVDLKTHFLPQLISSSHRFISVRCGSEHSLALTDDGKVWAWGWNNHCQVGMPSSNRLLPYPRQISELDPYRVVAVECGGWHSLALTDQGEVYAWGWNENGQLGVENEKGQLDVEIELSQYTPIRIPTPSSVKSMAAGYWHTLLLTQTGKVFAFGWDAWGQLGFPTNTVLNPGLFNVADLPPISQIESHRATNLSIAMSYDQRCFVWGEMVNRRFISNSRELPSFYSTVESPLSFYSPHCSTSHSVSIPETLPSPLSARMSRMFDNPETSPDVQFVVEQRTIHAHRVILSNFSDYFAQMFSERWLDPVDPEDTIFKVTISNYSYQVFHSFLFFLYTDYLKLYPDLLPEMFQLASQYLESNLEQLCLSRMRTTLSPVTCCHYYQFTLQYPMPELATFQQELVQFASNRMSEIAATAPFQSMDIELCKKLTLSMSTHSP